MSAFLLGLIRKWQGFASFLPSVFPLLKTGKTQGTDLYLPIKARFSYQCTIVKPSILKEKKEGKKKSSAAAILSRKI